MAKYKYILTVIITLCTLITYAQPAQYTPMTASGYQMKRLKVDSTLHLPSFCGVPTLRGSTAKDGALAIDTCGDYLYMWTNTGGWDTVNVSGGGSGGTQDLQSVLDNGNFSLNKDINLYGKTTNNQIYLSGLDNSNMPFFALGDSIGGGLYQYTYPQATIEFINKSMNQKLKQQDSIRGTIYLPSQISDATDTLAMLSDVRDANGDFWKTTGTTNLSGTVSIGNNGIINFFGVDEDLQKFNVNALDIQFDGGLYKFTSMTAITDTSTYKPLGIDAGGQIAPLTSWVSGGSTLDTTNQFVKRLDRTPGKDSIIYFVGANRFAIKDSVGGGGVPYTGATQDVDLGNFKISAQSFQVEGTNGLGHIHFKHQNSDATATGQSTVLYANSNGDLKYKNAGNYYSTLKTQQTADRIYTFQNKSYTLADSSDLTSKLNSADTSVLQRKSIPAYSILANPTSVTANASAQAFRDTSGTYSGTITWTGTTAPSGATNHSYRLTQVGKCVTLHIALVFASNGSALTAVQMTLPTGAPTPVQPAGLTGSIFNMYPLTSQLVSSANQSVLSVASRGFLRNNTAANGYEIFITFTSSAPGQIGATIQYWTN